MFSKWKNQTKQLSIISKVTLCIQCLSLTIHCHLASFYHNRELGLDYESRSELEQETCDCP